MRFISKHLHTLTNAPIAISKLNWNLSNAKESDSFFKEWMKSYIDYSNEYSILRPEQVSCFENILSSKTLYVPPQFVWSNVQNWKNLTGDENNNILYKNRNASKTIVILNNHLTWYEALYASEFPLTNAIDLHTLKHVVSRKSIIDYNFISITEDLTRINKNVMMYPSYMLEGISKQTSSVEDIVNKIKQLVPAEEYVVYTSCKNTMASCVIAGELGASRVYVQHGATSFVSNEEFTQYKQNHSFFDSNNRVVIENILENIYFTSYIRELHFNIKEKFSGINDIFDILNKYPNMKLSYGYCKNHPDLHFMEPWYEYLRSNSHDNLSITEFEHVDAVGDISNHWRLALKFWKDN